ncbi:MAG: Gx transporter family protein [Tissierellia bacterium]|nr:Gx transporter family protein [Tissierellia bacterium]
MRRLISMAVLVALALALSVLEMSLPLPFVAPGAKLGLSNIVLLLAIVLFPFREAFMIAVIKPFVLMLVTGSVTSLIYSMAGSILSCLVMVFAYRYLSHWFSLTGVSVLGSVAHNFAQITVAALILNNFWMYGYLPLLVLIGIGTGIFVGLTTEYLTNHLRRLKLNL